MLRRLHKDQPESFAFTPANQAWAEAQMGKYPEGRQASAIIPLLWRAQEQEGWLTRPAIEAVAEMLDMAYIRALEVATFYFMFQLQPVGSLAHVQVCGTTSCMICGAEDLISVCQEKIAANPHELSADGRFSWEEVECLGACANAPMVQIGKDFYEDLTAERFAQILDEFAAGEVPVPGPQNGRYAAEPLSGLTSLKDFESGRTQFNASANRAVGIGDTVRRIDGTEPVMGAVGAARPVASGNGDTRGQRARERSSAVARRAAEASGAQTDLSGAKARTEAPAQKPAVADVAPVQQKPKTMAAARDGIADNLKEIRGIGPKLEKLLHSLGFFHFDQVAAWTPAEVAWVDEHLDGFKGRVSRDDWVGQAKILASGGETEFSTRVDDGEVY